MFCDITESISDNKKSHYSGLFVFEVLQLRELIKTQMQLTKTV